VEGMGRCRAVVIDGPLFGRAEVHGLIDYALIELLAVDRVYRRPTFRIRRGIEMEFPSDLNVAKAEVGEESGHRGKLHLGREGHWIRDGLHRRVLCHPHGQKKLATKGYLERARGAGCLYQ